MFKETLQLKNKTIPFYLENLELILIHDSKLELSALDSLNQLSEKIVVSSLLVSISIGHILSQRYITTFTTISNHLGANQ